MSQPASRSLVLTRLLLAVLALAAIFASPAPAAEHEVPQPRLAVADGKTGVVRLIDLRRGERIAKLRLAGPAQLTTMGDRRHVLAAQSDQNRVDAIDAGTWRVEHGDHYHHFAIPPRLLPFRLQVPRPVHVVPHDREVAIFADDSGEAHVFSLSSLKAPAVERIRLATGKPHHGVAVPLGNRFLISEPAADAEPGALPEALSLRDARGQTVARIDGCPEMHGEASAGRWAAFACEDGVLVAQANGKSRKLSYPPAATKEARAWTLQTDSAGRRLVGEFGERALVVFELASGRGRVVPLEARIASFAVDSASGAIVVLTTDGRLRRIDPAGGQQREARRVIARKFEVSFERPSPQLAVAGGIAAVSDPRSGKVEVLHLGRPQSQRAFEVPGQPTSLAFSGV